MSSNNDDGLELLYTPGNDRVELPVDVEECMMFTGQGSRETRNVENWSNIRYLLDYPEIEPFDAVLNKWEYQPDLVSNCPHAPEVQFRIAVNETHAESTNLTPDKGDSYFTARKLKIPVVNCSQSLTELAVALHIYGNADHWILTKGEHLEYSEAVLRNKDHPRHELYQKFNEQTSGPNHFHLLERLMVPHCWVDHE
jgi:hypothetical protein